MSLKIEHIFVLVNYLKVSYVYKKAPFRATIRSYLKVIFLNINKTDQLL